MRSVARVPAVVPAVVLAVALAGSLGGCQDQREKYCAAIRADQARLGDMVNSQQVGSLLRGLPLLKELEKQAPDDLTDEWQTFVNAVEGLDQALKQAKLSPEDFQDTRMPDSVQGQERRDIIAAADTLTSAETVSASTGIETQAQDVCHVDIGL